MSQVRKYQFHSKVYLFCFCVCEYNFELEVFSDHKHQNVVFGKESDVVGAFRHSFFGFCLTFPNYWDELLKGTKIILLFFYKRCTLLYSQIIYVYIYINIFFFYIHIDMFYENNDFGVSRPRPISGIFEY